MNICIHAQIRQEPMELSVMQHLINLPCTQSHTCIHAFIKAYHVRTKANLNGISRQNSLLPASTKNPPAKTYRLESSEKDGKNRCALPLQLSSCLRKHRVAAELQNNPNSSQQHTLTRVFHDGTLLAPPYSPPPISSSHFMHHAT